MHGNVMEWCQDWHQEGSYRVVRGGGWNFTAARCRSAYRNRYQ
ncbi:MAG: SUMF1/EgtB/PvdO family nonheme iron enzyme, partial [Pirellulales bacterium]